MRLLTVTDLDSAEQLGNYKLRDSVVATRCQDGVTVADAAGAGVRSYQGDCYLIVNPEPDGGYQSSGDRFDIVPADTFAALFTFEGERERTQPEEAPARDEDGFTVGKKNPHVVRNEDGSVTIDGVTYNAATETTTPAQGTGATPQATAAPGAQGAGLAGQ